MAVLLSRRYSYRVCVNCYNEGICGCGVPGNICPVGMFCSSSYLIINSDIRSSLNSNFEYILYKEPTDATLAVLFISHCKITLHVSDAFCVHHQEY